MAEAVSWVSLGCQLESVEDQNSAMAGGTSFASLWRPSARALAAMPHPNSLRKTPWLQAFLADGAGAQAWDGLEGDRAWVQTGWSTEGVARGGRPRLADRASPDHQSVVDPIRTECGQGLGP